ncbi:MAG: hypothetical protein V4572_04190 [Bacteroidota bacterium]
MDNQDKIFEKIKNAANKAEEKDFPGMERIWERIDSKLEQKELQTKSKTWKKIAIAASIVLVISLGYQFLKPTEINSTNNDKIVVKEDSLKISDEKAITNSLIDTAKITTILEETTATVATKENQNYDSQPNALEENSTKAAEKTAQTDIMKREKETILKNKTNVFRNQIFDAIVVKSAYEKVEAKATKDSITPKKTAESNGPLVVVNGKATNSKYKSVQEAQKNIPKRLDGEELESFVVLKEPLYIINGVEYTEESLFGSHPTSPYAPLNKQNIETFEVLQDEDAIEEYGKKGSKGVVIITTKNGVPSQK